VDLSKSKIRTVIQHLAELGALDTLATGEIVPCDELDAAQAQAAAAEAAELQEQRQQARRSRLDMMRGYAEATTCRRAYLLGYFGEPFEPPCDACDNCRAGATRPPANGAAEHAEPFPLNSQVEHAAWGAGTVLRYEGDTMTVLFATVGYKTLATEVVVEERLLTPLAKA
jgi:ATP-dependent DNA helicase RecQ